jgi:hypothetical protein
LTNDFDPNHFRDLSFEEFKNEVAAISPSPIVRTFDDITSRTTGMFDKDAEIGLYFISDLQSNTTSLTGHLKDSLLDIYTIPVQSEVENNIYIDSCWFESPSRLPLQPDELLVRVRNAGNSTVEKVSVKLNLNGVQRSVGTTDISANSFEVVKLGFTNAATGIQFAEISLEDYPITYDDKYYLSYNLASSINILSVNGETASSAVKNVFDSEATFKFNQLSSKGLDYSLLGSTDLLILNEVESFSSGMVQEVMKYVQDGGHLLFVPAENPELNSTNELLLAVSAEQLNSLHSSKLKVEGVNLQSELFKNVFTAWEDRIDLPTVNKYFPTQSRISAASERLLNLGNGQPLLTGYSLGKGKSYVITAPLDDEWTNFHRHALFVPSLYNIALNSGSTGVSSNQIGANKMIAIKTGLEGDELLSVTELSSERSFVPERVVNADGNGIYVHDQVTEHGQFIVQTEEKDTIQPLSFNYNRAESDMTFLTPTEFIQAAKEVGINNIQLVEGSTESLANQVQELQNGKQLWRIFLILALACLLIETVLIRIL